MNKTDFQRPLRVRRGVVVVYAKIPSVSSGPCGLSH